MSTNPSLDKKIARLKGAINLEGYDRVPIIGLASFWPVKYEQEYTVQEAFYDVDVLAKCYTKAFQRWSEWDAFAPRMYSIGPVLDALGSKRYVIPGQAISPNTEYQHPDISLMSPEEYGELREDPLRFQASKILPRLCSRLNSNDSYENMMALIKGVNYHNRLGQKTKHYLNYWEKELAIPTLFQGPSFYVPVDWVADKLRGFQKGLLDIKMRPEELMAACESLVPLIAETVLSSLQEPGDFPLIFNPQHTSPFISPSDYDKIYWPHFKKLVDVFVGKGYKVWAFLEGNQKQHLERLQELPKGKVVIHFESTDLKLAKEILKGNFCIAGGMPARLLAKGTPQEVTEQTKSVLDIFQDEPGFIMATDSDIPINAKPENLDAWFNAVKEYGQKSSDWSTKFTHQQNVQAVETTNWKKPYNTWETVKNDFGRIEGDEQIIGREWNNLEKTLVGMVERFIR